MAKKSAGRKAAAEMLLPKNMELVVRPDSPYELDSLESAVWLRITSTLPADWFSPETYDLLVEFCRNKVSLDDLDSRIKKWRKMRGGKEYRDYSNMLRDQRALQSSSLSLATKMRMTQQARYTTQAAGTKANKDTSAAPWIEN